MRLLILDDDPDTIDCYRDMFVSLGFEQDFFTDSLQAELALRSTPYACIISDLMMPNVNGLSLVRRLRDGSYGHINCETPVIVATSFDNAKAREMLLGHQHVAVVAKPLHVDQLTELLTEFGT